jgi:hypothetical protein
MAMADVGLLKKINKVLTWASLALLLLVLVLVLKKSPAPNIPYDPSAAARVQQKFDAAGQAKAAGQTAQVQLDPTELNSYLKDNLQLAGSSQAGAGNPAAGTAPATVSSPDLASDLGKIAAPAMNGMPAGASSGSTQPANAMPDLNASADGTSVSDVQSQVKDVKVDMDGDLVKAYVIFNFHGKDISLELDGHLGSQDGYLKFDPVAGKLGELPLPQSTLQSAVEKMMNSPENREKLKLPDDISDLKVENGQAVVSYK